MSHVGIENHDALSTGGEQLGQESDNLRGQMSQLIDDMSQDANVLQGQALADFNDAKQALSERFEELMTWCGQNGIKLNEGQGQFNLTDQESSDVLGQSVSDLGGLSRPINA
ncbi:hypothetical protein ACFVWN_27580 [Nocardiopsis flavescens]|uniref:WXG100 family type VII secretion target n=1 Tax=Nocardiopsis flavescens TaxID=758803 RepID=A0A1M6NA09_9ACTN|nr:hypothetical protein [Nocardiopsis flavescens]SHJ92580.1 hypothetical protein SAMN05421803_111131 [Nocardiopsis flavescens]